MASQKNGGGDLGFEAELFKAADKLRGNLEPSEYKHVALGLIFLKYISEAFEQHRAQLLQEEYADPEDPEEYLASNVFWVPQEARWSNLQANAKRQQISFVDVTTGKERVGDIGNLILKGMSHKEIARLRNTSEATVRQQAQALYRKAGLPNKTAFAAFFLDEMLGGKSVGQPLH